MNLVHETPSPPQSLSSNVETADSALSQAVGVMFQRELPDDYALVMNFGKPKYRVVHTGFVFVPIDVIWLTDNTVQKVKRLNPFRGIGVAKADQIIEVPAGAADDIEPGDTVTTDVADTDE